MGDAIPIERFQDRDPPPTLLDRWDEALTSFLDPNPFILRPSEAGMGQGLDRLLGGGFTIGQMACVVSLGAGVGKTAFLHQFADGVAEASAERHTRSLERNTVEVVTPVVFVSEMTIRDLTLRSLARLAGVEGYLLRDPRGERGCRTLADGLTEGEAALQRAVDAADSFQDAARFITPLDRTVNLTIPMLHEAVERVREHWESSKTKVPAVLVIVDPIHRLLDPTKSEVEGLGEALPALLNLAQRTDAIVLLSSDTTKEAAGGRKNAGSLERGEELAHRAELAFRGNYQLLHMPDVALGLVTLRGDDEHLHDNVRHRLAGEPDGTMYAEIVNAKARWDRPGNRAAYFLDPAMFRFRQTSTRELPRERPLEDRIFDFIEAHADCSEHAVRKGVKGSDKAIRDGVQDLLQSGRIEDHGDSSTGRRLCIARTPHSTRAEQPRNNLSAQGEGQGVVLGGSPYGGEPPSGTTSTTALREAQP